MNTIKEITYYECSDGSVFKNHILAEKYIKFCDLINAIEVRYLNNEKEQYKHYILRKCKPTAFIVNGVQAVVVQPRVV